MRYHIAYPQLSVLGPEVDHNILSIEFGENLLAIRKKTAAQAEHTPIVPDAPTIPANIQKWEQQARASNP